MVVSDRVVHDDDFPISESEQSALDNIMLSETSRVNAEMAREAAEKERAAAVSEMIKRGNDLIDDVGKIDNERIVNDVLDALPAWEGGSY
jgi:hypothetical protein